MTDIDFPTLASQGADTWNQWRAAHPEIQPDLSRAYLYGQTLDGFDLSNTNLERACLIGANFRGANLSGACLQSVYASSSDFSEANLTGADLRQGGFSEANFTKANLSAASAQGTEFAGADFTGACLAVWQADHTTSLHEIQGEYLYLQLPPAGRQPRAGQFQPGELARFLQQRLSPGVSGEVGLNSAITTALQTVNSQIANAQIADAQIAEDQTANNKTANAKTADERTVNAKAANEKVLALKSLAIDGGIKAKAVAVVVLGQSKQLLHLCGQWLRYLQQQLLSAARAFQRDIRTELIPKLRRLWRISLRFCRYWYIRSARRIRRAGQQLSQTYGRVSLRSHQYLQTQARPAVAQAVTHARRNSLRTYRYWRIQSQRQLKRLATRCSRIAPKWAEFVQGNSRWQGRVSAAHQRLQLSFLKLSDALQVLAFQHSARLYAAGLVGERYTRMAIAQTREYLKQSKYLQSVWADLKKEYKRYPLPLAVGALGAIVIIFLSPLNRSERQNLSSINQVDARPVELGSLEPGPVERTEPEASIPTSPSTEPFLDPTPLPDISDPAPNAGSIPVSTPSVSSVSLPCPLFQPEPSPDSEGYQYQDGSVYYGRIVNGQPDDGQGSMTYPSGNRYDGEYKNGQRSGCGTFAFSDGRRYVGQFKADQFNGLGTWILENDERYIGEFKDNKCNGQGTFIYVNGSVKTGTWQDGILTDGTLSCEWGSLRIPTSTDN
ncbi:MAG: pentapeptide repeat-containing protein [Cyanobacteria bacterium J06560_2]